jgi:hypothetical protein
VNDWTGSACAKAHQRGPLREGRANHCGSAAQNVDLDTARAARRKPGRVPLLWPRRLRFLVPRRLLLRSGSHRGEVISREDEAPQRG